MGWVLHLFSSLFGLGGERLPAKLVGSTFVTYSDKGGYYRLPAYFDLGGKFWMETEPRPGPAPVTDTKTPRVWSDGTVIEMRTQAGELYHRRILPFAAMLPGQTVKLPLTDVKCADYLAELWRREEEKK
jgi:hypothetical protein